MVEFSRSDRTTNTALEGPFGFNESQIGGKRVLPDPLELRRHGATRQTMGRTLARRAGMGTGMKDGLRRAFGSVGVTARIPSIVRLICSVALQTSHDGVSSFNHCHDSCKNEEHSNTEESTSLCTPLIGYCATIPALRTARLPYGGPGE